MSQGFGSGPISREEVRRALDEVFAEPRFDTEPSLLAQFFEWLGSLFNFDGLDGEGIASFWDATKIATLLVALLLVLLMVHFLRQAFPTRSNAVGPAADRAQLLRDRVAELRDAARKAELQGDSLLALRLYFFALVVGLGERGELAYNDAWTNRELLERGKPTAEISGTLRPLLGELDSMSFGERAVETDDVKRFALLCERWLGRGAL